jgi:ribonuclease P protein component
VLRSPELRVRVKFRDESREAESPLPKLAVVMGRKKLRRAHDRNLVRRRLEEAFRLRCSGASANRWKRFEYVIMFPEAELLEMSFQAVLQLVGRVVEYESKHL